MALGTLSTFQAAARVLESWLKDDVQYKWFEESSCL